MERSPSLWTRTLQAMGLRQRVAMDPSLPAMTAVAGTNYPQPPPYDVQATYSALARFPWVWAAGQAIQVDLGGLPLQVLRGRGGKVEVLDEHPVLDLLARPVASGRLAGITLKSQTILDYAVGRNAFWLLDDARRPQSVIRVHPESAKVIPDAAYLPIGYEIGRDVTFKVPHDRVIHMRGPSWLDGPQQVYGTSPIQVLELLLNVEYDAYQRARQSAKRGRPDGMLTPGEGQEWTPEQVKMIQGGLDQWTASRNGTLVIPWKGAKLSTLAQTARDMEFLGMIDRGTSAQLAVMGVTPARVGIQSANYATARNESLIHWQNRQGEAPFIEAGMSALAERLGQPGDRVVFDFSGVPALQEARGEALARVSTHIMNGMDPVDAYREEGLDSAADRIEWAMQQAQKEPVKPAESATTKAARMQLQAAVSHLRLVSSDGIPADDVPELIRTLEAAGAR